MKIIMLLLLSLPTISHAEWYDGVNNPNYTNNWLNGMNNNNETEQPQQQYKVYNQNNAYSGSLQQRADDTVGIYDKDGHYSGYSKSINGETWFYNKDGHFVGKVKQ